jgi:hypothetical protein
LIAKEARVVLTYLAMSEEKIKYWAVGLVSNVRSIRWVAAAVLIASLVVAGCAPRSETPVTMVNGPSMRSSVVAMSMEPSIEVGDVTAVYVTVSNQSSNADPLGLTL